MLRAGLLYPSQTTVTFEQPVGCLLSRKLIVKLIVKHICQCLSSTAGLKASGFSLALVSAPCLTIRKYAETFFLLLTGVRLSALDVGVTFLLVAVVYLFSPGIFSLCIDTECNQVVPLASSVFSFLFWFTISMHTSPLYRSLSSFLSKTREPLNPQSLWIPVSTLSCSILCWSALPYMTRRLELSFQSQFPTSFLEKPSLVLSLPPGHVIYPS